MGGAYKIILRVICLGKNVLLYLWGISFHAVVVFGLDKNFLSKSVLGHCVQCTLYC